MATATSTSGAGAAASYDLSEPGAWARAVLDNLGAPSDPSTPNGRHNIAFLEAWRKAEGTKAAYNPLATTLVVGGSSDFNTAGVQSYASPADGITATVRTLLAGYPHVVSSLRAGDPGGILTTAGGVADLNRWVSGKSSTAPSSYTDTISALFYKVLGAGKSAYSGFGVGNFPVGHTTPAEAAGDAAKKLADATGVTALTSIAQSLAGFVGQLFNVNLWRRVGLAVVGAALMLVGVLILARGSSGGPSLLAAARSAA